MLTQGHRVMNARGSVLAYVWHNVFIRTCVLLGRASETSEMTTKHSQRVIFIN